MDREELTLLTKRLRLDLPNQLPGPVRYRRYVAALDERVFTSYFGTTTIEVCHYDYAGYCPFFVPACPETRIIAAYLLQLLGKEFITQEVGASRSAVVTE